jgi:hypothetical protein
MSIDPRLLLKLACPKKSTCLGLSKYCLDVHECDVNALKAAFARLVSDQEEIKSCMAKRLEYYQGQLSTRFDELFARELPSMKSAAFPIPISDEPKGRLDMYMGALNPIH